MHNRLVMTDLEHRHLIRQVKLVMSTNGSGCKRPSANLAGSYIFRLKKMFGFNALWEVVITLTIVLT